MLQAFHRTMPRDVERRDFPPSSCPEAPVPFPGLPFPFGVASSIAASCRSGNAACRAGQVRGWAQASSCTELTAGDCLQDYSLLHRNYSIIRVRSEGARK